MRLNAGIVSVGAIVAAMLPTDIRPEAAFAAERAQLVLTSVESPADVSVPEFVPLINLAQFLMAADENASVKPDPTAAAQELKIPGPGANADPVSQLSSHAAAEAPAAPMAAQTDTSAHAEFKLPATAVSVVAPEIKTIPVAVSNIETSSTTAAAASNVALDDAKPITSTRPSLVNRLKPLTGLGGAYPAQRFGMRSADRYRAGSIRKARLAQAAVKGVPDIEFQVGVPGQSMEPLISSCARPRACRGQLFCGC